MLRGSYSCLQMQREAYISRDRPLQLPSIAEVAGLNHVHDQAPANNVNGCYGLLLPRRCRAGAPSEPHSCIEPRMSVDSRLATPLPPIYRNTNQHGGAADPASEAYTVNVALFALTSTRCRCATSGCKCGSMLARDLGTKCALQHAHSTRV